MVDGDDPDRDGIALGLIGGLLAIGVAIALIPTRDGLGAANAALVLAIAVVAAAALGGRYTGAVTGFVAALSFDFWHVRPYGTLRIAETEDLATVILLMVVGVAVGELNTLRRRSQSDRALTDTLLADVLRTAHLNAAGAPVDVVWEEVRGLLTSVLDLADCRLEGPRVGATVMPAIDDRGNLPRGALRHFVGRGFSLPVDGVAIPLTHAGDDLGRVVLVPAGRRGVSIQERRVAVALVEQVGLAVARQRGLA